MKRKQDVRLEKQRLIGQEQKSIARRIRRRLIKKFGKRKHDKKEETKSKP